jgi:hypothetical protein
LISKVKGCVTDGSFALAPFVGGCGAIAVLSVYGTRVFLFSVEKLNMLLHGYLLSVIAPRRPMLFAVIEKLNTLLHDYLSPVIASDRKGAKQSSYLSVVYVSLSGLGFIE